MLSEESRDELIAKTADAVMEMLESSRTMHGNARVMVHPSSIEGGEGYSVSAAVYDEMISFTRDFREDTDPHMPIPAKILTCLMMMLGDDKIKFREEDLAAAEEWRDGRRLTVRADRDPLCYMIELED